MQIWNVVEELVRSEGLELFDLDLPAGGSSCLRVFIRRPAGEAVTHDDCAAVSGRLLDDEKIEAALPGNWNLEVSSPGINRRLRRPEHFYGAIGERVKVVLSGPLGGVEGRKNVVTGVLRSFDGSTIEIEDEELRKPVNFLFAGISKARVDYLFAE